MSIKSDIWIEKMAQEQRMIDPFETEQVREEVISYGLSSYGYDIRVADDFKIFHNVNSTIVDPKNFDANSFIEFQGKICTIPPNSFALGRSIEYMRLPRNVTGIVLGKSTYARCFSGNMHVALANGTSASFEDLATRSEGAFGYGIDDIGYVRIVKLDNPRWTGQNELVEVWLDNGQKIRCTPDHKFMLRTGDYKEASKLQTDESLMPLYRDVYRGYEGIYQPSIGQMRATHRLADDWNISHGVYHAKEGEHRHHKDGNKLNNFPDNIGRIDASEHVKYHNDIYYSSQFDSELHSQRIKNGYARLKEDDEWYRQYQNLQSLRAMSFWNDPEYADRREALTRLRKLLWSDPTRREKQRERLLKFYQNNPKAKLNASAWSKLYWSNAGNQRRADQAEIARNNFTIHTFTQNDLRMALDQSGSIRGAARLLGCDRSVFRRKSYSSVINEWKESQPFNHKVVAVQSLKGLHDTYCLTSETGNFALQDGAFVHNCGIVANFTPLEAGWEGHITIEISNTTPLPARIYANEGIAQVLFFESDEACRVSYADRQGKYQGQQGITTARV